MKRRARPVPIPAEWTTGHYFSALVKRHNWPPMFEPQPVEKPTFSDVKSRGATEARERQVVQGIGWAGGTCVMPGTPGHLRPAWMVSGRPA